MTEKKYGLRYSWVLAWWSGGTLVGEWKELVGLYPSCTEAESSDVASSVRVMGYTVKAFRGADVERHGYPDTLA